MSKKIMINDNKNNVSIKQNIIYHHNCGDECVSNIHL